MATHPHGLPFLISIFHARHSTVTPSSLSLRALTVACLTFLPCTTFHQTSHAQSPTVPPTHPLLGVGHIPGDAIDHSGLTDILEEGTPHNQLGGFSAFTYDPASNLWLVLADRGPADGASHFQCRVHQFRLDLDSKQNRIQSQLVDTTLLKHPSNQPYTGSLASLNPAHPNAHLSLDPEGIRLLPNGDWLLSDEYGPRLERFTPKGLSLAHWLLPDYARLPPFGSSPLQRGAVANRGLEGLTLQPDKSWAVAIMQGPLLQDSIEEKGKWYGKYTRVFAYDLTTMNPVHQWLYPLEDRSCGISEILWIDGLRFLVIERDGAVGSAARFKRIYEFDASLATDIQTRDQVDPHSLPNEILPVQKKLAIDLLDPAYPFHDTQALTKPEGLAWGPPAPSGAPILYVCIDNDFQSSTPSTFLAFQW